MTEIPLEPKRVDEIAATPDAALRGMIEMAVGEPAGDPNWDAMAAMHPKANAFHTSAWAEVLKKTYGHQPRYLRCYREGKPVALIPMMEVSSFLTKRRGVSLPFSDFCHPLMFDATPGETVFAQLREIGTQSGWKHLDLRGEGFVPPSATPAVSFYAHQLDLRPGVDELFRGFRGCAGDSRSRGCGRRSGSRTNTRRRRRQAHGRRSGPAPA